MKDDGRFGIGVGLSVIGLIGVLFYALPTPSKSAPSDGVGQSSPPLALPRVEAPGKLLPGGSQTSQPEKPAVAAPSAEESLVNALNEIGDGIVDCITYALPDVTELSYISVAKRRSEILRQPDNISRPYMGMVVLVFRHKGGSAQGEIAVHFHLEKGSDSKWSWVMDDKEAGNYEFAGPLRTNPIMQEYWISMHKFLVDHGYKRYVLRSNKPRSSPDSAHVTASANGTTTASETPLRKLAPPPAPTYVPASVGFRLSNQTVSKEKFDKLAAKFKDGFYTALKKAEPATVRTAADIKSSRLLAVIRSYVESATVRRQSVEQNDSKRGPDDCLMVLQGTGEWDQAELKIDLQYQDGRWTVLRVIDSGEDSDKFLMDLCAQAVKEAQ
jgi:hypothetical protein